PKGGGACLRAPRATEERRRDDQLRRSRRALRDVLPEPLEREQRDDGRPPGRGHDHQRPDAATATTTDTTAPPPAPPSAPPASSTAPASSASATSASASASTDPVPRSTRARPAAG